MRSLYTLLLYLATPLVLLYLFLRGFRDQAYFRRWPERFGRFAAPPRSGGIVVHAVSMGEVNAAKNLVRQLPAQSQVEAWVVQAKKLPRVIKY